MSQSEPDDQSRGKGFRGGFVGAFVRSVRRGQQSSAVGKVAVGALVVVLSAGSVTGLSVLLRRKDSSTTAATAQATTTAAQSAPSSAGPSMSLPASPSVSPSPGGRQEGGSSVTQSVASKSLALKSKSPAAAAATKTTDASAKITYSNFAGLGCAVNGASYVETGWYKDGNSGWWTLADGSYLGHGCDGRFTDMPMSGTESDTSGQTIMWGFKVGSAAQSCTLDLYVPNSSSARDVAAKSAHFAVVYGTSTGNSTYTTPSGEHIVDQSAHHSSWVSLGRYPVYNGQIGVKLTNRGSTSGYTVTYPHLAGGAVMINCTAL